MSSPRSLLCSTLVLAACSRSSEPKVEEAEPAKPPPSTRKAPELVPITLGTPCPTDVVLDCEAVVPAAAREEILGGQPLTASGGGCALGTKVTVSVRAAGDESMAALQVIPDRIAGLGRLGAWTTNDRVVFLASKIDCEITVQAPGRLEAAMALAKVIDANFKIAP